MEPRKATDVLLEIESKVNTLLDIVVSQDLIIKVLSNKLNDVVGRLERMQQSTPKITMEAVQTPMASAVLPPGFNQLPVGDPDRNIPISAQSKLPETNVPQGFRRNSRPETFAGDNAYLPRPEQGLKTPTQSSRPSSAPPGREVAEATTIVPPEAMNNSRNRKGAVDPLATQINLYAGEEQPTPQSAISQIPVMQRCVDSNGKSIFSANVEITDLSNGQSVFKTRTNGTGKWMASLGIGGYRVSITKRISQNKEKLEAIQDVQVDGTKSPLELPMLIIK